MENNYEMIIDTIAGILMYQDEAKTLEAWNAYAENTHAVPYIFSLDMIADQAEKSGNYHEMQTQIMMLKVLDRKINYITYVPETSETHVLYGLDDKESPLDAFALAEYIAKSKNTFGNAAFAEALRYMA